MARELLHAMIRLLESILPGEGHATIVGVAVLAHVVAIGLVVLCLATQDTTPDWLKAQKEKKG